MADPANRRFVESTGVYVGVLVLLVVASFVTGFTIGVDRAFQRGAATRSVAPAERAVYSPNKYEVVTAGASVWARSTADAEILDAAGAYVMPSLPGGAARVAQSPTLSVAVTLMVMRWKVRTGHRAAANIDDLASHVRCCVRNQIACLSLSRASDDACDRGMSWC